MSLHEDLLNQAHYLVTKESKHPTQASARLAFSASYYALFHHLIDEATRLLISREDSTDLRGLVSRAFKHNDMRNVCNLISQGKIPAKLIPALDNATIDPILRDIAKTFVQLQEMRHQADYDTTHSFDHGDELESHGLAQKAIRNWNSVRMTPHAEAFLIGLLIARHIHG